jgi:Tol biopolymer transport system component
MRSRSLLIAATVGLVAPVVASAQGTRAMPTPKYTKVLELDSMYMEMPSLSPNGRWIAFAGSKEGAGTRWLWIIPAAGGTPVALTSGDYTDTAPAWSPGSDRIVFKSTRVGGALMTMAIDPATGRATGAPQRLTLDVPGTQHSVSPDGRFVVYQTGGPLGGVLRVVPSSGGTTRTIDSVPPRHGFISPRFTADGRFIEYIHSDGSMQTLRRISAEGGNPVSLLRGKPGVLMQAGHGMVIDAARRDTATLRNAAGDTAAVFTVTDLFPGAPHRYLRFTSNPAVMLAVASSGSGRVHVIPSDGGSPRELPVTSPNDRPLGFLTDGRAVVRGEDGNRYKLTVNPLTGGTPERVVLPDSAVADPMTTDGKLVYWTKGPLRGVLDVATGTSRIISRNLFWRGGEFRGMRSSARDDDLYIDRVNGRFELRAWSPVRGESRLVRSIPATGVRVGSFHMRGDAAFWTETRGDSTTTVYTASSATQPPERVVSVRGRRSYSFSISRDGRRLATALERISGSDTSQVVVFAELSADGSVARPARVVSVAQYYSGIAWLPNNREIVFLGWYRGGEGGQQARLMKLGVEEGARPEVLASPENLDWDFAVSPDGNWISYPVWQSGKRAIWRVDLPGLTANPSRR